MIKNMKELNDEYKSRFKKLQEETGKDFPGFRAEEELSAWYKRVYETLGLRSLPPSKTGDKVEKPEPVKVEKAPKPVVQKPTGPRLCACGNEITKKPGRGRYPSKCAPCKEKV